MTGPIFEQIEKAYQFVLGHINLGVAFEGVYRVEQYEIPPAVFREAIANAVTHRNYLDASAIQVLVFDDRLEITLGRQSRCQANTLPSQHERHSQCFHLINMPLRHRDLQDQRDR